MTDHTRYTSNADRWAGPRRAVDHSRVRLPRRASALGIDRDRWGWMLRDAIAEGYEAMLLRTRHRAGTAAMVDLLLALGAWRRCDDCGRWFQVRERHNQYARYCDRECQHNHAKGRAQLAS